MTEQSLKDKTVKGTAWSSLDMIFGQGISFLVGIILARLLGPEDYGLIGIIAIFLAVFNSIVDSGFSNALIRKTEATEEDYNTVFYTNLLFSVVLAGVLFLCAPFIADFFGRDELSMLTRAMSSVIVINAFAIVQNVKLTRNIDFKTKAKVSLISSVCSGVIGIGMAFIGCGVWSLVGQQISRQFLYTMFLWLFDKWLPSFLFSWRSFVEMFSFGWKLMASALIETAWNEIYQVVIGRCYSPKALGYYTRSKQFASMFSSILTAVVQKVSYPVLSTIKDDKVRLKLSYQRIIKSTMLIDFTLMLGLVGMAKPVILLLLGNQWVECVKYLQIICFNMMLYPLHSLNLNMLQVEGRSDLFLKIEIAKKIICIPPLLLGVFVSIEAMLMGSVITGFVSYYLNAYYSGKLIDYSIWEQIRDIAPSFTIALVDMIVLLCLSFLPLSLWILFIIQGITWVLITVGLCEVARLSEYMELKDIAIKATKNIYK